MRGHIKGAKSPDDKRSYCASSFRLALARGGCLPVSHGKRNIGIFIQSSLKKVLVVCTYVKARSRQNPKE